MNKIIEETTKKINHNYFQTYDVQKQELYEIIKMNKIEIARLKGKLFEEDSFPQYASLFQEGASGLSFIDDPEDDKDLFINKLQNELHELTREYRETVNERENYKFLSLKADKDREFLVRKANTYKNELEHLRKRFNEFKQDAKNFEKESRIIHKAYQVSSTFVESLEEEVNTLRGQFVLLEGMIPADKLKSFQKQSPFTFMKKKSDMAKHDINNKAVKILNKMYKDTYKTEGTVTEICGIDKELKFEKEEIGGE